MQNVELSYIKYLNDTVIPALSETVNFYTDKSRVKRYPAFVVTFLDDRRTDIVGMSGHFAQVDLIYSNKEHYQARKIRDELTTLLNVDGTGVKGAVYDFSDVDNPVDTGKKFLQSAESRFKPLPDQTRGEIKHYVLEALVYYGV